MSEPIQFFVYLLLYDDGSYYVGKGHDNRIAFSKREHDGDSVVAEKIIHYADDEDDAFRIEDKVWCGMIKRRFRMRNKHRPGRYGHGDERSGWKHSPESRLKMRFALTKHHLTYKGVTKPLKIWAEEFGVSHWTVRWRLRCGVSVEDALTTEPDRASGVEKMKVTRKERGLTKIYTYQGETKTLKEWAEQFGLKLITVYARLSRGWSFERALSPVLQ